MTTNMEIHDEHGHYRTYWIDGEQVWTIDGINVDEAQFEQRLKVELGGRRDDHPPRDMRPASDDDVLAAAAEALADDPNGPMMAGILQRLDAKGLYVDETDPETAIDGLLDYQDNQHDPNVVDAICDVCDERHDPAEDCEGDYADLLRDKAISDATEPAPTLGDVAEAIADASIGAHLEALKASNTARQAALIADGCQFPAGVVLMSIQNWFIDFTLDALGETAYRNKAEARAAWELHLNEATSAWYDSIEAEAESKKAESRISRLQIVGQMPTQMPDPGAHLNRAARRRNERENR